MFVCNSQEQATRTQRIPGLCKLNVVHSRISDIRKTYLGPYYFFLLFLNKTMHGRPQGQIGFADPSGKMDEKLKSENMQQREQSGQVGVENGAMLTTYLFSILQNAPFRSQIFEILFASGGKGALNPLAKILRTPLKLCDMSR